MLLKLHDPMQGVVVLREMVIEGGGTLEKTSTLLLPVSRTYTWRILSGEVAIPSGAFEIGGKNIRKRITKED